MSWIRRLFSRRRLESDLDKELRFHFESQVAHKIRSGISESEARRLTQIEFGGIEQIKEACRESRGTMWLESILQDLRYGLRQLRKSPGFALTAVITLALGIGATTAIFTLVHGLLERSLPVADPSRLYRIGDRNTCCYYDGFESDSGDFDLFPYDLYLDLKQSSPEFEQLAAVEAGGASQPVRWGSSPALPLRSEYVSGNYFATLGVGTHAGRPLTESDDKAGAPPVLVLSYPAWQSTFAGDPAIVGSTVYVQMHPFTVVGVAAPGFFGDRIVERPPDIWMPLSNEPTIEGPGTSLLPHGDDDTDWLYLLGRVRPQTSIPALQSKLSGRLRQWMFAHVQFTAHGGAALILRQHVVLAPGGGGIQQLQQQTGKGLRILMILSSIVLLIACANFANLLLARGTARRAELSVRMALGAARTRIIRQILIQSVLLSVIGGTAGLAVAYSLSQMILLLAFPHARNMPIHTGPSVTVLGFAFLLSLLTGVVFGTVPAWLSSQANAAEALRASGGRSTSDRSSVPQKALVVIQVALSVVLLSGAFLMARSLANLQNQNFGIATSNRYVLRMDPKGAGYTLERLPALYREIEDRLSALPSAMNVSFARYTPLDGNGWGTCIVQQGHPAPGPGDKCFSSWVRVSARFLQSIGVPIVRGRDFSAQDTQNSRTTVLVNQAFARQFFSNQDPIGKHFGIGSPKNSGAFEIIGVFADFKMNDPRKEVEPLFLRPLTQQYFGYTDPEAISSEQNSMFLNSMIIQFSRPQNDVENMIRRALSEIDPNLTIFYFSSYDAQVAGNFNQDRLIASLTSLFGVLALTLASVGLYGVISFFVTRRTTEIGIRMAMGSTRSGVIALVLRGVLWPIFAGIALGIPGALYVAHFSASLLYGIKSTNPLAYLAAIGMLVLSAVVAGFIPSRRVASIDPMIALREE